MQEARFEVSAAGALAAGEIFADKFHVCWHVQALTLIADQVAATPQLPSHGLVTSLTAMHGLDGRHLTQVIPLGVLGNLE